MKKKNVDIGEKFELNKLLLNARHKLKSFKLKQSIE